MIEQMYKITCAVPRPSAPAFFGHLQSDGRVQLIETGSHDGEDPVAERLAALREKLGAILQKLGADPAASPEEGNEPSFVLDWNSEGDFFSLIAELESSVEKFRQQLINTERIHDTLIKEKAELSPVAGRLDMIVAGAASGTETALWYVPAELCAVVQRRVIESVADAKIVSPDQMVAEPEAGDLRLVCITAPSVQSHDVAGIMEAVGASRWQPPQGYLAGTPAETLENIKKRQAELDVSLKEQAAVIDHIRKDWIPRQTALYTGVDRLCQQYRAYTRCQKIGQIVLVEGWIPGSYLDDFTAKLNEKLPEVAVTTRLPDEEEYPTVPTALSHKPAFAPFALFLKLVQPPAYGSVDPTSLIAIFFPLFSGCIIGDAGYAVVMLALAIFFRSRTKNKIIRDVTYILISMSVWAILWGFAFGEFFGDTGHRLFHMEPLWVERSQAVLPVLLFSVALGLAHVLLGLFVGFLRGLRSRHKKHAVEKLGGILVIVAAVVALMGVRQFLPAMALPTGIAMLIVGLVLLAAGGGIGGLIESMSSFGHILSYVRIGAIGLSSAILAVAASKFIDVLGLTALGIFIALAIHLLNFVLAFAESGLHAARLHYVEFMGNFYEAKGTTWRPFIYRREQSWKKDS